MNSIENISASELQLNKFLVGEIITSYNRKRNKTGIIIRSSQDIYALVKRLYKREEIEHREKMFAVFLSHRYEVMGWQLQSVGGLTGTVCDPKILFQGALTANASAVILVHNHPSGNLKASHQDILLTKKVNEGAKLLDMQLLDHLIISDDGYVSLADEGLI
jgi:DNA repair protein RadC